MKRWPPFGTSDGTPWTNGNPAIGQRGSVIDARAIDHAQAEIVNAITRLGLTPSANDLTQLGRAIQNAIDAATGGGPADGYVTVESARARLPIFPEVLTADGRLTITSPSSGTVLVAPTGILRHRGIFDVNMADIAEVNRTFSVLPSKVAHLRWSPSGGLALRYLDDPLYNAGSASEDSVQFDSTFDDVLLARIITDASAVPVITRLSNRAQLTLSKILTQTSYSTDGGGSDWFTFLDVYDWARAPTTFSFNVARGQRDNEASDNDFNIRPSGATLTDLATGPAQFSIQRYRISQTVMRDWTTTLEMHFSARA